jgi:hypothetical protein
MNFQSPGLICKKTANFVVLQSKQEPNAGEG